ncbi:MAG: glycosyltransferase family 2 protein [Deltaproteobacteria bacterium]|nr:glycosyltransferase family 2 protein [Deltaproteobacteria bacterium]
MSPSAAIDRYLKRHAHAMSEAHDWPAPASDLSLVVVIPCLAESQSIGSVLDSLELGFARFEAVEVLLVVNQPEDAPAHVSEDNQATMAALASRTGSLHLHVLDRASPGMALDPQQAGVGLARRLGMDLALRRLVAAGRSGQACIACLDADSPVAPGYLDELLRVFASEDQPLAGVCAYRHPVDDPDPELAQAMVAYELWMRYFEQGLRLTASPFSYPTIGSCIVCSAHGYALADGMPPRQAGEDFHFFQKLIKLASDERPVLRLRAQVHPSARPSWRVPLFGTGRALLRCLEEGPDAYRLVEPPEAFFEIQPFFAALKEGFVAPEILRAAAGPRLAAFMEAERGWQRLESIRANQSSAERFARAAMHWFDGLRIVRYAHHLADELGRVPVMDALQRLAKQAGGPLLSGLESLPAPVGFPPELSLQREMLELLRSLD